VEQALEDVFAGRANSALFFATGTGSNPPRVKGWHRKSRQVARVLPRSGPWVAMATWAYSEHEGINLHPPGLMAWMAGENQRR
jgi:hypothetical protein